jgi:transposase-like protein
LSVITERYKSGEAIKKLSQDYGVCYQTIRKYLNDAKILKIAFRRKILNKIHLEYEVKRLYINQRLSMEKMASMLGTSPSSIRKFMQDNGIKIRTSVESNTKISPEQLNEIAKRHQNGETVLKLANEYGVSDSAIGARFKKGNIVFQRPNKISNSEEIIELYHNQRLPTTKISMRLGVAKPTLLAFMRKNNIPIRTAGQSKMKLILTEELCNNIKNYI